MGLYDQKRMDALGDASMELATGMLERREADQASMDERGMLLVFDEVQTGIGRLPRR